MPDPVTIVSAIPAVKAAFDTLRAAIGLVKDTKDLLPKDEKAKADVITAALATAESSSQIAEAEVAKALGYELCKCSFPPTIMLTVGELDGRSKLGLGPCMNARDAATTLPVQLCTSELLPKENQRRTGRFQRHSDCTNR